MIKSQEMSSKTSCLNRAMSHEMLFVLMARDKCAPETIRYWCDRRILVGLNKPEDKQILEALDIAELMELQRKSIKKVDQDKKKGHVES